MTNFYKEIANELLKKLGIKGLVISLENISSLMRFGKNEDRGFYWGSIEISNGLQGKIFVHSNIYF